MELRTYGLAALAMLLALGIVRGQEKPLTEIPDEDAPLIELKPLHRLKCENYADWCLVFSPDGKVFAVVANRSIVLWNTRTGKEIRRIPLPEDEAPGSLAFSPDGREIACRVGLSSSKILTFDIESGKRSRTLAQPEIADRADSNNLHFSADGKSILFFNKDTVRKCHLETSNVSDLYEEHTERSSPNGNFVSSPDRKVLAISTRGKPIRLLDLATDKPNSQLLQEHESQIPRYDCLAFSPSSRLFAAAVWGENLVKVWDIPSGKLLWKLSWPPSLAPVNARKRDPDKRNLTGVGDVVFSYDERTLRASCSDRFERIWELSTGKMRYRIQQNTFYRLVGSTAAPFFASTNCDGESYDSILLWDWRTCVQPLHPPTPDLDKVLVGLTSDDASAAFENMRILNGLPKETTALFEKRFPRVERVAAVELQKLITDLDDEDFEVRTKAQQRLRELSDVARGVLTRALEGKPSSEARHSITSILDSTSGPLRGERLCVLRAVEVLEMLGTPDARTILKRCASGEPAALLTREAKAALFRLTRE